MKYIFIITLCMPVFLYAEDSATAYNEIIDFISTNTPSVGWKEFTKPDYKPHIMEDPYIVNYDLFNDPKFFLSNYYKLAYNVNLVGRPVLESLLSQSLASNNLTYIYNISSLLERYYPSINDIKALLNHLQIKGRKRTFIFKDPEEGIIIANSITNKLLLKCIDTYLIAFNRSLLFNNRRKEKIKKIEELLPLLFELHNMGGDFEVKSLLNCCIVYCYEMLNKDNVLLKAKINGYIKYVNSASTNEYPQFNDKSLVKLHPIPYNHNYTLIELLYLRIQINNKRPFTYFDDDIAYLEIEGAFPNKTNLYDYIKILRRHVKDKSISISVTNITANNIQLPIIMVYSE